MKNLLFVLSTVLLLASCGNIEESITISKDGSGTQEYSADMIPMMRQMMMGFAAMSQEEGEELDSAELAKKVEDMIWKDFPDEMDSIISFDDRITPELRADPEKMEVIENTTMFMKGGRKFGYVKMGAVYKFEEPGDLELFNKISQESGQTDQRFNMYMKGSETVIKATDKSFFRSYRQKENDEEMDESSADRLMKMLGETTFTTTLNVPGKIRSVDLKTYELIERTDQSVTVRYRMADFLDGQEVSIDVKWK